VNPIRKSPLALAVAALLGAGLAAPSASANEAVNIIERKCLACHTPEAENAPRWSRISHQRKTPEGWLMTIGRMQMMHGLQISDAERRTVVKYLADRQGLAPEEAQPWRYAMERKLTTMESFADSQFEQICARCHSGARVGLQRRPEAEWEHLVHFHLGQWPSTEYQALARDRDWLPIALDQMVPKLAKRFPLQSDSWKEWQATAAPELEGRWSFAVHQPGRGDGSGSMRIRRTADDQYRISLNGKWADGSPLQGSGQAVVYTGYEWRAQIEIEGIRMRQVLAADKTGAELEGRMFEQLNDERGMSFSAAKQGAGSRVLAVYPANLKAGSQAEVTVVGTDLSGEVSLGKGVTVDRVLSRSAGEVRLQVTAADTTAVSAVKVGKASGGRFVVYQKVDHVTVVPDYTIARVGGNGGSTPKVQARFEALGWLAGKDGKAGTADDIALGPLAASWRVEPFDEAAKADRDVEFAGRMDQRTGIFTPGAAGPNPARRMSTNNAGNLKVIAEVKDGDQQLEGDGQLIVTVQRWNNAPLP